MRKSRRGGGVVKRGRKLERRGGRREKEHIGGGRTVGWIERGEKVG